MRQVFIVLVGLFCIVFTQSANSAIELTQLYQNRVAVADQSRAERTRALQEAFANTLLKVTADKALLDHPAVTTAMQNVNDYVTQYSYQRDEQLWLWAQFDPTQMDQLIQQADSGIWSNLRPELLFWIAIEDEDLRRTMIGADNESALMQRLKNEAELRGLPIKLPLLDLNDTMSLSMLDVWGRFEREISFASSRYSPDGVVVARVYQTEPSANGDKWMADWQLKLGQLRWQGMVTAMEKAELGALLIDQISEELAQRYRIGSTAETINRWQLTIDQLNSIEDTISAEKILSEIPSVIAVQLKGFGRGSALFELTLQTDPARIRQAIDLHKSLDAYGTEEQARYRWVSSE